MLKVNDPELLNLLQDSSTKLCKSLKPSVSQCPFYFFHKLMGKAQVAIWRNALLSQL